MKNGDKVKWVDGLGYEHTGVVDSSVDDKDFMIPVRTDDGRILAIRYLDLHIISEEAFKSKGE